MSSYFPTIPSELSLINYIIPNKCVIALNADSASDLISPFYASITKVEWNTYIKWYFKCNISKVSLFAGVKDAVKVLPSVNSNKKYLSFAFQIVLPQTELLMEVSGHAVLCRKKSMRLYKIFFCISLIYFLSDWKCFAIVKVFLFSQGGVVFLPLFTSNTWPVCGNCKQGLDMVQMTQMVDLLGIELGPSSISLLVINHEFCCRALFLYWSLKTSSA